MTTPKPDRYFCLSCSTESTIEEHCPFCGDDVLSLDEYINYCEEQDQRRIADFHDGGGQPTLDEQHRAAWEEKQRLRR